MFRSAKHRGAYFQRTSHNLGILFAIFLLNGKCYRQPQGYITGPEKKNEFFGYSTLETDYIVH